MKSISGVRASQSKNGMRGSIVTGKDSFNGSL